MVVPEHAVCRFNVERLVVRIERNHVVAVAYFVVGAPPVRCKHFRVLRQTPVVPCERIPNLKAGVLHTREQAVVRPVARKGEEVAAGLQHALTLARPAFGPLLILRWLEVVPLPTHERQSVGWIGDDGVNALVVKVRQYVKGVARVDEVCLHRHGPVTYSRSSTRGKPSSKRSAHACAFCVSPARL